MSELLPPYVLISSEVAKDVPKRWLEQYCVNGKWLYDDRKRIIYEQLCALPELTPRAINEVIGNDSWTRNSCSQCGEYADEILVVGQKPDYESATAKLCEKCLNHAITAWNTRKEPK